MKRKIIVISIIGLLLLGSFNVISINVLKISNDGSPEFWAILVAGEDPNLDFIGEVKLLYDSLIFSGWKAENIQLLLNNKANSENIYTAIEWICEREKPSDTVLICLCGHGGEDRHEYIWYYMLEDCVAQLISQSIGIIIDGCYSGTAIPYLQEEGRIIVTSTDDYLAGSGFTASFAPAFQGFADLSRESGNHDCIVSLEEAYRFVKDYGDYGSLIQDNCSGEMPITVHKYDDNVVDQYSSDIFRGRSGGDIGQLGRQWAQSFVPSFDVLTKIWLPLTAIPSDEKLIVSIRKSLDGEDLTSISTYIAGSLYPVSYKYVEFDFPDVIVNPGEIYYIVLRAEDDCNTNYPLCIWVGQDVDSYSKGQAYYTWPGSPWIDGRVSEMLFATFGKRNTNAPPNVPMKPTGPIGIENGKSYTYYTSTEDFDDDRVYYLFDWGDNTDSGWLGPYSSGEIIGADNSWYSSGSYIMKVKSKDEYGIETGWSGSLTVSHIPGKPEKPSGLSHLKTEMTSGYTSRSIDIDHDRLQYGWDWNGDLIADIWTDFFNSGESVPQFQAWYKEGTYEVRVKARDVYGAESIWSDMFKVNVTKKLRNRAVLPLTLSRLLEQFSLLQLLTQLIIKIR